MKSVTSFVLDEFIQKYILKQTLCGVVGGFALLEIRIQTAKKPPKPFLFFLGKFSNQQNII